MVDKEIRESFANCVAGLIEGVESACFLDYPGLPTMLALRTKIKGKPFAVAVAIDDSNLTMTPDERFVELLRKHFNRHVEKAIEEANQQLDF